MKTSANFMLLFYAGLNFIKFVGEVEPPRLNLTVFVVTLDIFSNSTLVAFFSFNSQQKKQKKNTIRAFEIWCVKLCLIEWMRNPKYKSIFLMNCNEQEFKTVKFSRSFWVEGPLPFWHCWGRSWDHRCWPHKWKERASCLLVLAAIQCPERRTVGLTDHLMTAAQENHRMKGKEGKESQSRVREQHVILSYLFMVSSLRMPEACLPEM